MKKFFSLILTVMVLLMSVNFAQAAEKKSYKIKFNNRQLKKIELEECPVQDDMIVLIDENIDQVTIFGKATADGKKLDGLVHSAGIAPPTPLRVLSENIVDEILEVNLISFMFMTAAYSKRKYNDGGSIVGVSSLNAHYPQKCMSIYAASKNALEAFALTTALELAEKNIRINCVIPGAVDTPMLKFVIQKFTEYYNQHTLLKILQPEDIAGTIVFLLSDMSKKITGRSMYVDGGWLGQ